jgi:hypothetical protein
MAATIKLPGEHLKLVQQISQPNGPIVTAKGATGSTSYSYYIVAKDASGNRSRVSAVTTITNGNATLSVSNYNEIKWPALPGAVSYDVLRGGTGTTIAKDLKTNILNDTGLATTAYTAPTANETAQKIDKITGAALTIASGSDSVTWTHNFGSTNYVINVIPDQSGVNLYYKNKTANSVDIYKTELIGVRMNDYKSYDPTVALNIDAMLIPTN